MTYTAGDPGHVEAHNDHAAAIAAVQAGLDGKAAIGHAHVQSDVTGLDSALASKAAVSHAHSEGDVTGLVSDLASKASATHTHPESDVSGLGADLSSINTSVSTLNTTASGHETRISALEAAGAGNSAADYGYVLLDDFSGATDDDKLGNALSFAAAQTYPPTIRLTNRKYTFAQGGRAFYTGLRIEGPPGYGNAERNSQTKMASEVHLTMDSVTGGVGWFDLTGGSDIFSTSFTQLAFTGGSQATVFTNHSTGFTKNLYCMMMRDITCSGLRSFMGTQSQKVLLTAAQFDGYWELNNCYNGAIHIGGSDNTLFPDGCLIDSGTVFNTNGSANGQYHFWFDFMEKSYVGPLYMTAEGAWNGIKVSGPSNPATSAGSNMGGPIIIHGARIEGRNAGAPCNGSLVRVDGGIVLLDRCWISYGMASPATPGHSPQDAGVIHQEGGQLDVDGCTYDHATSVAETVPFVYSNGGEWGFRATKRASKGGAWTGRPRYAGAISPFYSDSSMTT